MVSTRPRPSRHTRAPLGSVLRLLAAIGILPGAGCLTVHPAVGTSPPHAAVHGSGSTGTDDAGAVDGAGAGAIRTRADIDDAWPARWGREGRRLQGVIAPLDGPLDVWRGMRLGDQHHLRAGDEEYADVQRLNTQRKDDDAFRFRAEGPGAFVFVRRGADGATDRPPGPDDPSLLFKFVSGEVTEDVGGVPGVDLQRTWFAYYDAAGPRSGPETRGTVILVPGMFGTPHPVIERAIRAMRLRGWAVLHMLSHPSRFTERVVFPVDIESGVSDAARHIAGVLTGRAAEAAYAVEAAVAYLDAQRPDLAGRPRVLMGMSGGAMALPTIHARAPDAYDAAVLIAGGANFLLINERSNYASYIRALNLEWTGIQGRRPTDGHLRRLSDEYLEHAALDGYHTAPLLEGKPVLMIHGATDRAVPADTGDLLWERIGRPERWVLPVGHEVLFVMLPGQFARIGNWLDEQLPPPEPEP